MTDKKEKNLTYRDAGVNIDLGDQLVKDIGSLTKKTARPGANTALGGFGALFDLKEAGFNDPILVAATDGVGTKLEIAHTMNKYYGLGIDLVAMCANDILASGGMPLFFLDYFATGSLEPHVAQEVIAGIAEGCVSSGCALIGGETAEMPGIYPQGRFDLAGFCVGAVERGQMIDINRTKPGDLAIAIAANGFHANGFSLIRKVLEINAIDLNLPLPFTNDESLGDFLLTPTALYPQALAIALKATKIIEHIHGVAHITGGGLIENPPRAFSKNLSLDLDLSTWTLPPACHWLMQMGNINSLEMARVFNCGIGLILYTEANKANAILDALNDTNYTAWIAGELIPKQNESVQLLNLDIWDKTYEL